MYANYPIQRPAKSYPHCMDCTPIKSQHNYLILSYVHAWFPGKSGWSLHMAGSFSCQIERACLENDESQSRDLGVIAIRL